MWGDVHFGLLAPESILRYMYAIYIYLYMSKPFTVSALLKTFHLDRHTSAMIFDRTDKILDHESLQNDMDPKDRSQIRRILTGWKITWDLLQTSTWRYRWNPVTLRKCFCWDVAGHQRSRRP